MADQLTWAQCQAQGMTAREAAQAMGRTTPAAYQWAKRARLRFAPVSRDAVRAAMSAAQKRRFAVRSEVERMNAARSLSAKMRKAMASQPPKVREDYRALRRAGYSIHEALAAVGKADLLVTP